MDPCPHRALTVDGVDGRHDVWRWLFMAGSNTENHASRFALVDGPAYDRAAWVERIDIAADKAELGCLGNPCPEVHELGFAHELIHLRSSGDLHASQAVFRAIEPHLASAYERGRIAGYSIEILFTDEDCERELVKPDWKAIPGASFPVVYLFVQPMDGVDVLDETLAEELARSEFVLVRIGKLAA